MNQKISLILGGALVLLVLVAIVLIPAFFQAPASAIPLATTTPVRPLTVNCMIGSEKQPLLDDPEAQKLLRDRYLLSVIYKTKGSMDQVTLPADQTTDLDCLWPSNISASLIYQKLNPSYRGSPVPLLFSPLVIYSTIEARDILKQSGYVEQRGNQYFIVKMNELVKREILAGKTWQNLNAPNLKGPIKIQSTDPGRSNSGFLLFGLYANVAANDAYTPASADDASKVLPLLKKLKDLQGLQFTGSEDAFNNWYAQSGFGAPLLAAYESQILEKSVADAQFKDKYGPQIYTLYPEPSVQAVHVIIPLTANAHRLIDAMRDPDIQSLAWKKHGFRSLVGAANDPKDFSQLSVPQNIQTTDLPSVEMIGKMLDCLRDSTLCQ